MNGMLEVAIYVIGPIGILIAMYGFWLAHKVDQADPHRDAAHHPAE